MSIHQMGIPLRSEPPVRLSAVSGGLAAFLWVVAVMLVDSVQGPALRGVTDQIATNQAFNAGVLLGGAVACVWFASLLSHRLGAARSNLPSLSTGSAVLLALAAFGLFSLRRAGPSAFDSLAGTSPRLAESWYVAGDGFLAMAFFAAGAFLLATGMAGLRSRTSLRWLALISVAFGLGSLIVWLAWAAQPVLVLWCLCACLMMLPSGRQSVLARR